MPEIIHKKESYAIIGACFEVYNEKGCGFLEPVYQECLGIEFEYQRIPAIAKPSLAISYRSRILKQTYEPDYVCFEKIIVELKAVSALTDEHRAQLLNYLHATGFELGLLVNFGHYPTWNTNALRRLSASNQKPTLPMSPFDLFASIRVIRGLLIRDFPCQDRRLG
jgi:GxxExxY protein